MCFKHPTVISKRALLAPFHIPTDPPWAPEWHAYVAHRIYFSEKIILGADCGSATRKVDWAPRYGGRPMDLGRGGLRPSRHPARGPTRPADLPRCVPVRPTGLPVTQHHRRPADLVLPAYPSPTDRPYPLAAPAGLPVTPLRNWSPTKLAPIGWLGAFLAAAWYRVHFICC
jgi:hypothetical protein